MSGEIVTLRVAEIGVRGDGVALHDGQRIFLPLTAPGDLVRARLADGRAEIIGFDTQGARAAPRCSHFGACGGCALQHLTPETYAAAKTAWLAGALRQHGLAAEIKPLRGLPAGTRRRARFSIARPKSAKAPAELGFQARASHRIVDLRDCAVLHPALLALAAPLRRLAPSVLAPGERGAATATRGDSGLDLLLDVAAPPALAGLEALAEFARAQDLARLVWRVAGGGVTPVAQNRPPRIAFAGIAVDLPDEGFLQASPEADAVLIAEVLAGVGEARAVADLYAGIGTFSLPLAARAAVHAVEQDAAAVAALAAAAARAGLGHRLSCERRDLDARPLSPDEFARFDTVVFDPPRAGAKAQSATLAKSRVPRIVAVSCNPATFARDARTLADGGYRLGPIQPVDSFLWSPHLELVATLDRP
jgi:23S rRNA (uracil1939-C5)-methyltransferase